jgi:uncharacterized membrane protein YqjE
MMRDSAFTTSDKYYTATYCLVLVVGMLLVVLMGVIVKLWRLKQSLKKNAYQIKTSFLSTDKLLPTP